jgi:hypothetical protein
VQRHPPQLKEIKKCLSMLHVALGSLSTLGLTSLRLECTLVEVRTLGKQQLHNHQMPFFGSHVEWIVGAIVAC